MSGDCDNPVSLLVQFEAESLNIIRRQRPAARKENAQGNIMRQCSAVVGERERGGHCISHIDDAAGCNCRDFTKAVTKAELSLLQLNAKHPIQAP